MFRVFFCVTYFKMWRLALISAGRHLSNILCPSLNPMKVNNISYFVFLLPSFTAFNNFATLSQQPFKKCRRGICLRNDNVDNTDNTSLVAQVLFPSAT